MAPCSWTCSSLWVSWPVSRLPWQWAVLQVWCWHWVWQWMPTCWYTSVPRRKWRPARRCVRLSLQVTAMLSVLSSTLTWLLSSQVLSFTISEQVLSRDLLQPWLSVSLSASSQLCSWHVWYTLQWWPVTSGWTWSSKPILATSSASRILPTSSWMPTRPALPYSAFWWQLQLQVCRYAVSASLLTLPVAVTLSSCLRIRSRQVMPMPSWNQLSPRAIPAP